MKIIACVGRLTFIARPDQQTVTYTRKAELAQYVNGALPPRREDMKAVIGDTHIDVLSRLRRVLKVWLERQELSPTDYTFTYFFEETDDHGGFYFPLRSAAGEFNVPAITGIEDNPPLGRKNPQST